MESHLKEICMQLAEVNNYLSILDEIERATAMDVERSSQLLNKVSDLEKDKRGKSDVTISISPRKIHSLKTNIPSDVLTGLTGIEKRLLALEGIGREKGMQTDQMEGCMIKLKRLENQLSKNQTIVSNGGLMPDQSTTSGVRVGVNFSQRYIDELVVVISKIEGKVQYLEQLYRDVLLLQGQAETLKENIHLVEQKILMKSNEQSKLEMTKSENSLCISEKLEGKMENIAILEKEISDLLKESDMNNIGKKLDSIDEWEVVDKQSLQEEMSASSQQCLSSADVAKKQIGKGLQRTYSQETTELIAKVDGIKESVDEQKALRMLERENSLEFLDYGGTGGPVEQEAALLLERVDQGLTQIITDQSETHLMSSLQREFTPDRLESDTSLADHEREKKCISNNSYGKFRRCRTPLFFMRGWK